MGLEYRNMPLFKKKVTLEDELINLRMASKQMQRASRKGEKSSKEAEAKVKKAIQQNNPEGARIYAQDAIREKNHALNCLKMSSRIDAVGSRVETAVRMGEITKGMQRVVKGMDAGLASMDVEKLSKTMDKFEKQFEDMDVKTAYMDDAMNATTATSTPVDQVDQLISAVADQHNLELAGEFIEAGPLKQKMPAK